jgi:hypothetical protein
MGITARLMRSRLESAVGFDMSRYEIVVAFRDRGDRGREVTSLGLERLRAALGVGRVSFTEVESDGATRYAIEFNRQTMLFDWSELFGGSVERSGCG